MRKSQPRGFRMWWAVLTLGIWPTAAGADDFFLTIGGGPTPFNNQVSLEKNVLYYQRLLADLGIAADHLALLFSDGSNPGRDLHAIDATPVPRVNALLAALANNEDSLRFAFRSHEVPGVTAPATKANVQKWLAERCASLRAGDRLFIYVTGHGGKGKPERNGHFYLWRNETMNVEELAAELDKLPPEVCVVSLMVQCYSGAFANLVFKAGKDSEGATPASRCGFFATVESRPAAGCTPAVEEENYAEYSSYFLAALAGRTRTGNRIEPPDYNRNGSVSFDEAHAYAMLTADTIDIPVKTSDAFLRKFSRLGAPGDGLMTLETPCDELLQRATPADQAVLEGLTAELSLTGSDRIAQAKKRGEELEKQRKEFEKQVSAKRRELARPRQAIADSVRNAWPELRNPFHPHFGEIVRAHGDEIIRAIESHAQFARFAELRAEAGRLSEQELSSERQWAKTQRILRVAENVALAANLAQVADEPTRQRFAALVASESGALARPGADRDRRDVESK